MDLFDAMARRRSIRQFTGQPVARERIEEILLAATKAPSAKNRQPWRFVVAEGAAKDEMTAVMERGLAREKEERGHLPGWDRIIAGAFYTLKIMKEAPVTVFVLNPEARAWALPQDIGEGFATLANLQSTGAAIQNLLLAAEARGLGSLWICDIFSAYPELLEWLGTNEQLVAAVSLGYPAETPGPRPRRPFAETVSWKQAGE